jgi:hypothetical protein
MEVSGASKVQQDLESTVHRSRWPVCVPKKCRNLLNGPSGSGTRVLAVLQTADQRAEFCALGEALLK